MFLTFAAAIAYRRGAKHIVTGVCETDYSGYPDCRDDTLKAMQIALNLGMETRFVIHTPLMWIDKAATWGMAGISAAMIASYNQRETHTCYLGNRDQPPSLGSRLRNLSRMRIESRRWRRYND